MQCLVVMQWMEVRDNFGLLDQHACDWQQVTCGMQLSAEGCIVLTAQGLVEGQRCPILTLLAMSFLC